MTDPGDLAQASDVFLSQLAYALAQQDPDVAARLEREFWAGNYELARDGATLTLRIGGVVVLEATLYPEPHDVKLN